MNASEMPSEAKTAALGPMRRFVDFIKDRPRTIVIWLLVAIGIVTRACFYLHNRSLWLDESSLALNIIEKDFAGLAQPLDHHQAAPLGFLYLTKLITLVGGYREPVLRFLPFVAGIGGVLLFPKLASKLVPEKVAPYCVALFALSPELVYYAQEFKPYSSDGFVSILTCLATLNFIDNPFSWKNCAYLSFAVAFASCFSFGPVFVTASTIIIVAWVGLRERNWRRLACAILCALISGGILSCLLNFSILQPKDACKDKFLVNWWRHHYGFLNLRPKSWESAWMLYLGLGAAPRLVLPLLKFNYVFAMPMLLIGAIGLAKIDRRHLCFLLTPMVLGVIASSLEVYPWSERVLLYYSPQMAVLVGVALYTVAGIWRKKLPILSIAFLIICLFPHELAARRLRSFDREEHRKLFVYLKKHNRERRPVYVYLRAIDPFLYYRHVLGLPGTSYFLKERWPTAELVKSQTNAKQVWLMIGYLGSDGSDDSPRAIDKLLKNDFDIIDSRHVARAHLILVQMKDER